MDLVQEAEDSGATRSASCEILNLDMRRLQRWQAHPEQADGRAGPKAMPLHTLSDEEKRMIIEVSTSAKYKDSSPWEIVAKLADLGRYLASESSFYRVLKEKNMIAHRGKEQPKRHAQPKHLIAVKPNEVWSWDITYLKTSIKGKYYYLYLIEDIFSRMIVGWRIEEMESAECAAELIEQSCIAESIGREQLNLHSDNGSPMKGSTMLAKLQSLGVMPSFSRPQVSNDNPYSESLFKTLKYRPSYPDGAFASMDEANEWVGRFVSWYNEEHLHSGIKFVTPLSRHQKKDKEILRKRTLVYELAKKLRPTRWSKSTRNWSPIIEVHLNQKKKETKETEVLRTNAA
jgi:putative transposase